MNEKNATPPPWPVNENGFPAAVPLPDSPPLPPERAVTFDDLQQAATAALDRIQTAAEEMGAISIRESSEDGYVTVDVNGKGELTGLWLDDAAMEQTGAELGAQIVATASAAVAKAFGQVGDVITAFNEKSAEIAGPSSPEQ